MGSGQSRLTVDLDELGPLTEALSRAFNAAELPGIGRG